MHINGSSSLNRLGLQGSLGKGGGAILSETICRPHPTTLSWRLGFDMRVAVITLVGNGCPLRTIACSKLTGFEHVAWSRGHDEDRRPRGCGITLSFLLIHDIPVSLQGPAP